MGIQSRTYPACLQRALPFALLVASATSPAQVIQPLKIPLFLPGALVYDTGGNLYFAESSNHLIRRIDAAGNLTTIAGTGIQGFGGDAGPATAALLDSPQGIALTASGVLYLADTHNHRIRRVDLASGLIMTIAGTGAPGFSGDGALATAATLDLPTALALDALGNLFLADTENHRIRRIDHLTATISTVAGDGTQDLGSELSAAKNASLDSPTGLAVSGAGDIFVADTHHHRILRIDHTTGFVTSIAGTAFADFSGEGSPATSAGLNLPHGLTSDRSGNLYLSDSGNHRIRRIDASTGLITTIAGNGIQAFAGDEGPAIAASLDTPRAVALTPASDITFSDTANQRIRQVDGAFVIRTIAGLDTITSGAPTPGTLILSAPSAITYGTGIVTATLNAGPASGPVTFYDGTVALGSTNLAQNIAIFATSSLYAGQHQISAIYAGSATVPATPSAIFTLTISPASLLATPKPFSNLYGTPIPSLTGSLAGLLLRDQDKTYVTYGTLATAISPPGIYPVTAHISGAAAGNYTLTSAPAALTILQAHSTAVLVASSSTLASGSTLLVSAHVLSTTSGIPSGAVTLRDGSQAIASSILSVGAANFPPFVPTPGVHILTATYPGDANFLNSIASPIVAIIASANTSDFALAVVGPASATIPSGTVASFSFSITTTGPPLSSPILLNATGLPVGSIPTFNPAYLPPGLTAFQLTLQNPTAQMRRPWAFFFALILIPFLVLPRSRRNLLGTAVLLTTLNLTACGDRINTGADTGSSTRTYPITVTATATAPDGTTLVHTATVTLILQ